jgi:MFS transporter, NNP family, nitrate/nitrite transporter
MLTVCLTYTSCDNHLLTCSQGILSGLVGASGNFGGIIFAIIFRYNKTNYSRVFWIMGIMVIILNTMFMWVRPIPKGQIGGR